MVVVALTAQALAAPPGWALQTTIGGHQVDLDGRFTVREVFEENGATTHERTLEQLRVRAAVSLAEWLRFDSTTVGLNGGPTLKADRSGVNQWEDVFQDVSPALDFEEAFFDIRLPSVDLRVGKQKVAWGKLDRFQPNDLINPLNYSDPFLQEEAERKLGVPALQASYYLPAITESMQESRFTAVWVPRYLPYRFPTADCQLRNGISRCDVERWFPPAAIPVTNFMVPPGIPIGGGNVAPAFTVPVTFSVRNTPPPAWRLENSSLGLRYAALVQDLDFALYYYHGFDVQPAFNLTAMAFGQPDPDPNNPLHLKGLSAATTLAPEFRNIDSWGADAAYPLDSFTVRAEGAFVRGRPFPRDLRVLVSDPQQIAGSIAQALGALAMGSGSAAVALPDAFVVRDAVEWGVGADYVYEGYLLLFQLNQTDVLRNHQDLIIKDVETRLLANLRKGFLSDTLSTQLVAVHAIESDYTYLRPRVSYQITDHIGAEVGYLFIAGRAHSVVGQYRRNDEGWVRFEYRL